MIRLVIVALGALISSAAFGQTTGYVHKADPPSAPSPRAPSYSPPSPPQPAARHDRPFQKSPDGPGTGRSSPGGRSGGQSAAGGGWGAGSNYQKGVDAMAASVGNSLGKNGKNRGGGGNSSGGNSGGSAGRGDTGAGSGASGRGASDAGNPPAGTNFGSKGDWNADTRRDALRAAYQAGDRLAGERLAQLEEEDEYWKRAQNRIWVANPDSKDPWGKLKEQINAWESRSFGDFPHARAQNRAKDPAMASESQPMVLDTGEITTVGERKARDRAANRGTR